MSDEKRRVLEMLEAGKISQEDALRLLEALGEGGAAVPVSQEETAPSPAPKAETAPEEAPSVETAPNGAAEADGSEAGGTEAGPEKAAPVPGSLVEDSFSQAMAEVRAEVGEAVRDAGKALSDAADEAMAAMSEVAEEVRSIDQAVPKLTLWPETPMGAPLEEPDVPDMEPEYHVPRTETPEHAPFQALAVEGTPYTYPGAPQEIESIDIEWISGPVEIRSCPGDTVHVTEYAKRPLDYGQQLEFTVDGRALRIRWTRERAFWKGIMLTKHLVVEIPSGMELEKVKLKNVSGSVSAAELCGRELAFSSTSGRVEAVGIAAGSLKLSSVSGAVRLEGVSAESLSVDTTSGRAEAVGIEAGKAKFNTVSGSLKVYGNAEKFALNTISGSIELKAEQLPEKAGLESVSGRVSLTLPENGGFTVKYNSMSGHFYSDFPLAGSLGRKSGKGSYGSGDASVTLNTMSGGMELHKA